MSLCNKPYSATRGCLQLRLVSLYGYLTVSPDNGGIAANTPAPRDLHGEALRVGSARLQYQAAIKMGQQPAARVRAEEICARFIAVPVGSEHAVTIEQGQRASVFEHLMEAPLGIEAFKAAADVTSSSLHGDHWPHSSCSAGLVREQVEHGSPLLISLQIGHSHYAESVSLRLRAKKQ